MMLFGARGGALLYGNYASRSQFNCPFSVFGPTNQANREQGTVS